MKPKPHARPVKAELLWGLVQAKACGHSSPGDSSMLPGWWYTVLMMAGFTWASVACIAGPYLMVEHGLFSHCYCRRHLETWNNILKSSSFTPSLFFPYTSKIPWVSIISSWYFFLPPKAKAEVCPQQELVSPVSCLRRLVSVFPKSP